MDIQIEEGLVSVVVQDAKTKTIVCVGYMDKEAYHKTTELGCITLFDVKSNALFEPFDTMKVVDTKVSLGKDALLFSVELTHTDIVSEFNEPFENSIYFLKYLQDFIDTRKKEMPEGSYTTHLFNKGINKIAQKVGEEAVETIIEAKDNNDELFLNESADLMYHLIVLLTAKNKRLEDIVQVLASRHK